MWYTMYMYIYMWCIYIYTYGGSINMGSPKWMVYNGKSYENGYTHINITILWPHRTSQNHLCFLLKPSSGVACKYCFKP